MEEQKNNLLKFNVVFISLNWHRLKDPRIPLAHASLSAVIRERLVQPGYLTLHNLSFPTSTPAKEIVDQIIGMNPDILLLGVYI